MNSTLLTLSVICVLFGLLTFSSLSADIVLLAGVLVLVLCGVLSPGEALAGFSNEGMVTVAILYVVGAGVRETGGVDWIAKGLFGRPKSMLGAIMSATLALLGQ